MASLISFPAVGDTTILFELNASKSLNYKGLTNALSFRWDFEGDSIWDTDYRSENSIGHIFIDPGNYRIVVEVSDFFGLKDTASTIITVFGMNKDLGILTDPRDEQVYRTIKINGSYWMAENLHYGTTLDRFTEQKDNGIVEMYRWKGYKNGDTIGGTYRWLEVMDYNLNSPRGICPEGWHIPTKDEFSSLLSGMPPYYSIRYYGRHGLSGLNLDISNHIGRTISENESFFLTYTFGFWSSSFRVADGLIFPGNLFFDWEDKYAGVGGYAQSGPENNPSIVNYLPVRCKKD